MSHLTDEEQLTRILDRLREVEAGLDPDRARGPGLMGDVGVFLGVGILGAVVFGVQSHALLLFLAMWIAVLLRRGVWSLMRMPLRAERRRLLAQLRPVASRLALCPWSPPEPIPTSPRHEWDEAALARELDRLSCRLPEDEAVVLRLHYGLHGAGRMTLKEIGALLGTSPLTVQEILLRGLSKIRHGFGEDGAGSPAWLPPPVPGPLFQSERPPPPDEDPYDQREGR